MSFVFLGTFQKVYDKRRRSVETKPIGFDAGNERTKQNSAETITEQDLIGYGIPPELVGRLDRIVTLDDIGEDEYANLIKNGYMKGKCTENPEIDEKEILLMARQAHETKTGLRWIEKKMTRENDDRLLRSIGIIKT